MILGPGWYGVYLLGGCMVPVEGKINAVISGHYWIELMAPPCQTFFSRQVLFPRRIERDQHNNRNNTINCLKGDMGHLAIFTRMKGF